MHNLLEKLDEYWELDNKRKQLTELAKKLGTSHPKGVQLNMEVDQLALKLQGYILSVDAIRI